MGCNVLWTPRRFTWNVWEKPVRGVERWDRRKISLPLRCWLECRDLYFCRVTIKEDGDVFLMGIGFEEFAGWWCLGYGLWRRWVLLMDLRPIVQWDQVRFRQWPILNSPSDVIFWKSSCLLSSSASERFPYRARYHHTSLSTLPFPIRTSAFARCSVIPTCHL